MKETDILIVGAGPVGLFTVFEAGLLGLNCTLIDNLDKPGGQCAELYPEKPIYDIPGVPFQTAQEHVDALLKQIEPFDYDLNLSQRVQTISEDGDFWIVETNEGNKFKTKIISCKTIRFNNSFAYSSRNKLLTKKNIKTLEFNVNLENNL